MEDGNEEFPVPLSAFLATIADTTDEVWSKWLIIKHGRENHVLSEWRVILNSHRDEPAWKQH